MIEKNVDKMIDVKFIRRELDVGCTRICVIFKSVKVLINRVGISIQ